MKLDEYRRKREPATTNEPFGDEAANAARAGTRVGAFVVHLHDATRRHYDVRLEVAGVLASFAVPRGPSLDPAEKHLAVKTEDHPIEYLDFEDVIPEGQYGAGPMIVWDRGKVEYLEGPAEEEIARGKLDLRFHGYKLKGRWALVRLAQTAARKGDEWLLIKKHDGSESAERDLVAELPRSVLSGLTVEQLEQAHAIGEELIRRAHARGARVLSPTEAEALLSPTRSPLAGATPIEVEAASGARKDRVYDADLDGVRVAASRDGDVVSIRTFDPSGAAESIEAFYPDVVRALRALPVDRVVLDGQLVAFDPSGHPSISLLAARLERIARGDVLRAVTAAPVVLVASDLLLVGDADVRPLALATRRELLDALLPAVGALRASPPLEGSLAEILAFCTEHGIVGVIAKPKTSPYLARTDAGDGAASRRGLPRARKARGKHDEDRWQYVVSGAAPRGWAGAQARVVVDHRAAAQGAALRRVAVTNRAKVFWPAEGYTKGDLCDYYGAVADTLLPYLESRPVILVRYPDGIEGKSFYQWNVPAGMPPWVRTLSFEDDEVRRGFLVDDASTLLYIANLGCIPLHVLACRVPDLEKSDFATIDLDVKQSTLKNAIILAKTLRELLDEIGLPGFPKTSGQSGLHVLVPLGSQSFATARALADLLGRLLVERHREIATMERIIERRGSRVYVDTGQTGRTRAIVAPYSVRAVPGATVSTPLGWDEVDEGLDPREFTIRTVPERLAGRSDPMASLLTTRPDVARAVARLAELVSRSPEANGNVPDGGNGGDGANRRSSRRRRS